MGFKLDIFGLLSKIDNKKVGNIYQTLSDEEKKGFAPLVVMRWMSGTSDERQIMMLNTFMNPLVFALPKHPELLMRVLQVCSSKTPKRYQWLGIKGGTKKKNIEAMKVVGEYYDMSQREVRLLNPFPPSSEIISMAEELGYEKDEMKKLEKELKS